MNDQKDITEAADGQSRLTEVLGMGNEQDFENAEWIEGQRKLFEEDAEWIEGQRKLFEEDAEPYGFDLTRQDHNFVEPWADYDDDATGHRWGGWLARAAVPNAEVTGDPHHETNKEG